MFVINIMKLYARDFTGKNFKDSYLKACKWVASNIIKNNAEVNEIFWNIIKLKTNDYPACRLTLYVMLDDKTLSKNFCDACKEFHRSFFINQEYNCNACRMVAYKKQQEQRLKIKMKYYKGKLKRVID